jgi:hypothetical protein
MVDVAPSKVIKSVNRWTPNPAPVSNENLSDYLFHELNRLSDVLFNLDVFRLEPTFKDPLKSREGDIRYAAGHGTSGTWGNTLGADGIYWYNGTSWTAL